jgi:hypothetical protein
MLADWFIAPSIMALVITGLILLTIIITVFRNFDYVKNFTLFQKLSLLCVFTIATGSHGLLHAVAEKQYKLNPYQWL